MASPSSSGPLLASTVSRRTVLQGSALVAASVAASGVVLADAGIPAAAAAAPGAPRGVHLSFVDDPTTSLSVVWFTDGTADPGSLVRWAPAPGGAAPAVLAATVVGTSLPAPGVDVVCHQATIAGLVPGQPIGYQVGSAAGWSPVRVASPLPPAGSPVRIAVFGDQGTSTLAGAISDAARATEPDVALIAGDISYANGRQTVWDRYFDVLEPLASIVPTLTALGNHDSEDVEDGGFGFDTYEARFAQPGRELHYSVRLGNVHVCVLEAGEAIVDPMLLAEELAFLESDLALASAARAAGAIDFICVLQHFPLWNNEEDRNPGDYTLISTQEPIFQRYGIDLLLVGHNHHYERSFPMVFGTETTTEPADYGADRVGMVQVITGGGGQGLYEFLPDEACAAWSAVRVRSHGVTVLDADGPTLVVRHLAIDEVPGATASTPVEVDRFTLVRRTTVGPVGVDGADPGAPAPVVPEAPIAVVVPVLGLVTLGVAAAWQARFGVRDDRPC